MSEGFIDYYAVLGVEPNSSAEALRKAFRTRLLEVHPDKAAHPTEPDGLRLVMEAFEILGDSDLRERYDRTRRLFRRELEHDPESEIPHVTESERPANRARAILYLLLNAQPEEAVRRLDELESLAIPYLSGYLEPEEFIDASFLLGEFFEGRRENIDALRWFQQVLNLERKRRRHRPCYPEAIERAKRLLIQRLTDHDDPRVALEYLRRAEQLGLSRLERVEVCKRRAQCYLSLDMKNEAAKHLREALELQPQAKGVRRLREALADYL